jgi:sporulation protein YlmC with PRC-barrel domain
LSAYGYGSQQRPALFGAETRYQSQEIEMTYADRDTYGMYKTGGDGPGPALMGADTLIGNDVVNDQEADLGDIKEIMLDMRNGHVAYAVLSFGGFLGLGEKLFAIPWQALHLDTANKRFILNVSKERLKSAPGFDPDRWPDMTDPHWINEIHSFYGTEPYTDMALPGSMTGSSTDTGSGVRDNM